MKFLFLTLIATLLAGCELARTVAPHTTAGFEAGGILGALDGASGAVLATCRTLDGVDVRIAIDNAALGVGKADTLDGVREQRQRACAVAGAIAVLGGAAGTSAHGIGTDPMPLHAE